MDPASRLAGAAHAVAARSPGDAPGGGPTTSDRAPRHFYPAAGAGVVRPVQRLQPGAEPGRLAGPDRTHPEQPAATWFGAAGHRQRRPGRRCRWQELGAAARAHHRQRLRHEPAAASGRPAQTQPRRSRPARRATARRQRPVVRSQRAAAGRPGDDLGRRRCHRGDFVAAAVGLPALARFAGLRAGAGGHALRCGGLRGVVRPYACDDAGTGFEPDRCGGRLPAALPVQKLEPETLAQLACPAPDPARLDPEPDHQRHRLPGPGLDTLPGADPDCRVLCRRVARRLFVRRVPAAGIAQGRRPAPGALAIARLRVFAGLS
ncbi:hypothetical protein D3C75_793510 [compost metagenome]